MTLLDEYLTLKDAAQLLGVSQVTIWRWIKAEKLSAEKFGREVAIRRADLTQVVKSSGD